MQGYHKIKVFELPVNTEVDLPEGWKPFGIGAVIGMGSSRRIEIIARKWERSE